MSAPTHTPASGDLRLAARQGLLPAEGKGWLAGFGNLLGKELGEWFGTRRWLWQAIIWLAIINGMVAMLLFIVPAVDPGEMEAEGAPPLDVMGLTMYYSFVVMAGSIGAIILAQDEIIQEKQSGTAAWILSKPAARPAFLLSKLLSAVVGVLVFIVAVPGLVALGEIFLATNVVVPLLPYLAGMGVSLLALVFYLSLVILLGVLFESRGPVLGIAFGVMFGGMIVAQFLPQLAYVLPLSMDKIALAVAQGQPLPAMAVSQIIATVVLSIVFVLVALWRFQHKEF